MHASLPCLAGLALSGVLAAQSGVVLNEVRYDAAGSDEGQVFVEIFGPAGTDVGGWQILAYGLVNSTAGNLNAEEFTFPVGTLIPGDGILVVADGDVDGGSTQVPNADFVDADMDLQNGADAVVLIDAMGNLADALGYGDMVPTTPALVGPIIGLSVVETLSAPDVFPPLSLQRQFSGVDTDNNFDDFDAGIPTPGVAQGCVIGLQSTGLNGGRFNAVTVSNNEAIGFDTWASCAANSPQVMLLSLTDPTLVPPPAPLPLFDQFMLDILALGNTPVTQNFTQIALSTNGRTQGQQIVFDTAPIAVGPAAPFDFFIASFVLSPTQGFLGSNVARFTVNP